MSSLHQNPKQMALLERRQRAETRFRWYGRLAVWLALGALALLMVSLSVRSYYGFVQARIALDVDMRPYLAQAEGRSKEEVLATLNYSKVVREALRRQFPEVTGKREKRDLNKLLSSGAGFELREQMLSNPAQADASQTVWLLAADAVDLYLKGRVDEAAPEYERKLRDNQLVWLKRLESERKLALRFNARFFAAADSREPEQAGFFGAVAGSFLTLAICLLVAFPLGVMTAVYLEEFARDSWLKDLVEVNINNLAAVPSIIFGLLGLAVYLNAMGLPRSAPLVGGLTLALMILPVIIISTRVALGAIPDSIRLGASGLGASRLQVVLHHVLPLAMPGIMTGTILGLARAIGETAPLLMIGMVAFIADPPSGFADPATVMPVQIFLWASSPEVSFVEKTAAGIMVLLAVLIAMNSLAIWIRKRYEIRW